MPLVASYVVVPLLEVVSHTREGGVHKSEAGDVNVVVFVWCQVETLKVLQIHKSEKVVGEEQSPTGQMLPLAPIKGVCIAFKE